MAEPGHAESIVAVYGDVERESAQMLRVDRMLVLRGDGALRLTQGPSVWYAIDTNNEKMVKFTLALMASRGEREVIMEINPDAIFVKKNEEFDEILRKYTHKGRPTPSSY